MRENKAAAVSAVITVVCKTRDSDNGIENSEIIGLAAKLLRGTAMLRSVNGMLYPVKTCTDP